MSSDTLVFDMASSSEGSPSVFVKKDWLSILDNQNQNYQGNQIIFDTSQLSNSSKFLAYRESYILCPLLLTLTGSGTGAGAYFTPAVAGTSCDFALGLKNWYGSIIHSFTLDYNGTTIIQQTPFIGMWNCFKLMTSLSYDDLVTQSSQLGFYPDTPLAWTYEGAAGGQSGIGVCNNMNAIQAPVVSGAFAPGESTNVGLLRRQQAWAYDPDALTGTEVAATAFSTLMTANSCTQLWKSYISRKVSQTAGPGNGAASFGAWQVSISAIIYLKDVASFFERVPLLKGVFMKLTLNVNQSSVAYSVAQTQILGNMTAAVANTSIATITVLSAGALISIGDYFTSGAGVDYMFLTQLTGPLGGNGTYMVSDPTVVAAGAVNLLSAVPVSTFANVVVNSPLGGVQPIMITSALATPDGPLSGGSSCYVPGSYVASLAVGNKVLNSTQKSCGIALDGPLGGSCILNVPAYTFNPVFESSYMSSSIKKICYTDVYQYQIVNTVKPGQNFNNLISNGLSNLKSVCVLPFFSATQATDVLAMSPYLSPFDPAGAGPTSPLCLFNQFNIQISGQNAIYNSERYAFEQFQNQLYGCNAVNGGMTSGMSSGLIDSKAFESEYCYYYVDVGRMLPVEEAVPKSVNILGLSMSALPIDLFIFCEYGVEISIDVMTGSRV